MYFDSPTRGTFTANADIVRDRLLFWFPQDFATDQMKTRNMRIGCEPSVQNLNEPTGGLRRKASSRSGFVPHGVDIMRQKKFFKIAIVACGKRYNNNCCYRLRVPRISWDTLGQAGRPGTILEFARGGTRDWDTTTRLNIDGG